jgi:Na+/citrate or Na+/malate symporter
MARTWACRPHVIALVGALVLLLVGIGLLISPWDGLVGALAWVLIVIAIALAALTLFFARTPSS